MRGEQVYEEQLRTQVEIEASIGKIIVIAIETGDYERDADLVQAGRRLRARHPQAATWTKRIGYNAVYALGGTLMRRSRNEGHRPKPANPCICCLSVPNQPAFTL